MLAALEAVRDPELDEPITSLGFVASCTVSATGDVAVGLRLPTYFCAPNFAFPMGGDAHAGGAALDGVAGALIALPDGLMVANRIPSDLNADTLAALARSYRGPSGEGRDIMRAVFQELRQPAI